MASPFTLTAFDRVALSIAPRWAMSRIRARVSAELMVRHFEAASTTRRTMGWTKRFTDANAASGPYLANLRAHSRELIRNNGWARNARRVVNRNVVGYGITPKPVDAPDPKALMKAWKRWAGSTQCDAAERLTFTGLQKLWMSTIFESGEVLIRRRWRQPRDGMALPIALQTLEPDHIDTSKHDIPGIQGGPTVYGVEFDAIGRRVAYWLFDEHPGSSRVINPVSRRIDAREIIHAYDLERAGQDRGIPWLCAAIVKLKDFDEFEDGELMKHKIAALLAGFIENDLDAAPVQVGAAGVAPGGSAGAPPVSVIEPGILQELKPGQKVSFTQPPSVTDDGFSTRTLRYAAAAIGVTYEDLVGDYSQVNFSSARMSRLAHWGNVYDWQYNMVIPQVCDPVWGWAMTAAALVGLASADAPPSAEWTPMPMPMTEPDKEARANVIRIRSGQATLPQVLREQGIDPDAFLEEYAAWNKKLDALGVWLDSDPRRVSQAGLTQERVGAGGGSGSGSDGAAADGSADGSGDAAGQGA
jgi:lambda family phage portal protein